MHQCVSCTIAHAQYVWRTATILVLVFWGNVLLLSQSDASRAQKVLPQRLWVGAHESDQAAKRLVQKKGLQQPVCPATQFKMTAVSLQQLSQLVYALLTHMCLARFFHASVWACTGVLIHQGVQRCKRPFVHWMVPRLELPRHLGQPLQSLATLTVAYQDGYMPSAQQRHMCSSNVAQHTGRIQL